MSERSQESKVGTDGDMDGKRDADGETGETDRKTGEKERETGYKDK